MIQVQVIKKDGKYSRFMIDGHAGYADAGEDIVCAAVSALVVNTINSIEAFTEDGFTCDCKEGIIQSWEFTSGISPKTELLMDSLLLGLEGIESSYGEEYLTVKSMAEALS